jgi:hypothetical protein
MDGENNQGPDPTAIATKMKHQGTEIYCVGVGSGIDKNALAAIASLPTSAHLFTVGNFSGENSNIYKQRVFLIFLCLV